MSDRIETIAFGLGDLTNLMETMRGEFNIPGAPNDYIAIMSPLMCAKLHYTSAGKLDRCLRRAWRKAALKSARRLTRNLKWNRRRARRWDHIQMPAPHGFWNYMEYMQRQIADVTCWPGQCLTHNHMTGKEVQLPNGSIL